MTTGADQARSLLTRRLVVALSGCVVLAVVNPLLYDTPWWSAVIAGAVAAALLVAARILIAQYRRTLDSATGNARRAHPKDVAIFVVGASAGPTAAIPLATEVGSALVMAVPALYALTRFLLVAYVWWLRRRLSGTDSEEAAKRKSALEGERGIFHFGEVVLWALLLVTAWGSLLTPVPFGAVLFMKGWYTMSASYLYFVRLL